MAHPHVLPYLPPSLPSSLPSTFHPFPHLRKVLELKNASFSYFVPLLFYFQEIGGIPCSLRSGKSAHRENKKSNQSTYAPDRCVRNFNYVLRQCPCWFFIPQSRNHVCTKLHPSSTTNDQRPRDRLTVVLYLCTNKTIKLGKISRMHITDPREHYGCKSFHSDRTAFIRARSQRSYGSHKKTRTHNSLTMWPGCP